MNERTLIERLNIPWPEHETEEVTLPAWVIELCAEGAARIAALEAQLAEAVKNIGEQARLRGEAEGKLAASEMAGVVEGWKERAEKAEAQLAELAVENERLRKDAERYRALRDGNLDDLAVVRGLGVIDYGLNVVLYTYLKEIEGDEMDNAIDAARRALKEAGYERS